MLEWALQNDINWSENDGLVCWNKNNQDIWMFLFYPTQEFFEFCVHSNNLITKLVFDVFIVPIIHSELGGKEP
jgi:hypothetical protein